MVSIKDKLSVLVAANTSRDEIPIMERNLKNLMIIETTNTCDTKLNVLIWRREKSYKLLSNFTSLQFLVKLL